MNANEVCRTGCRAGQFIRILSVLIGLTLVVAGPRMALAQAQSQPAVTEDEINKALVEITHSDPETALAARAVLCRAGPAAEKAVSEGPVGADEREAVIRAQLLVGWGKTDLAEQLLLRRANKGREQSCKAYAALLLAQDKLDKKLAGLAAPASAEDAQLQAYLYLATGQPAKALEVARKADNSALVDKLLMNTGAWQELLDRLEAEKKSAGKLDAPQLAQQALLLGFLGQKGPAANIITQLAAIDDWDLPFYLAINDQVDPAVNWLIEKNILNAVHIRASQGRHKDVLTLLEEGLDENGSPDQTEVFMAIIRRCGQARQLWQLGEKAKAQDAGKQAEHYLSRFGDRDWGTYLDLVLKIVETKAMCDQADAALARVQEELARDEDAAGKIEPLLSRLYPVYEGVTGWMAVLHADQLKITDDAFLRKLDGILRVRLTDAELGQWVDKAAATDLPAEAVRSIYGHLITSGKLALAEKFFQGQMKHRPSYALASEHAWHLALTRQWKEALAEFDALARRYGPTVTDALTMSYCHSRLGQKDEAAKCARLAACLMLDFDLVTAVKLEVFAMFFDPKAVEQSQKLQLAMDDFSTPKASFSPDAKTEDLEAAMRGWQQSCLRLLADTKSTNISAAIHRRAYMHKLAAAVDFSKKQFDAGMAEASQAMALTDSIELHGLVGQLDALGQKDQADKLFAKIWDRSQVLLAEYPKAGEQCNNAAWTAALCHRNLDEALKLAATAVSLDPTASHLMDTQAEVLFQLGKTDEALKLEQKAMDESYRRGYSHAGYYQRQIERFKSGNTKSMPE